MHNLKTRTQVLSLTLILVLFLLISLIQLIKNNPKQTRDNKVINNNVHVVNHLRLAHSSCEGTLYPELCVSTLASFRGLSSKSLPQIISSLVNHTLHEVKSTSSNCSGIRKKLRNMIDPLEMRALDDCLELFDDTVSELEKSIRDLSKLPKHATAKHYHEELETLLSAAMTNQYTCLDGFAYSDKTVRNEIENSLFNITRHVSNTLAMIKKMPGAVKEYGENIVEGFPSWVSAKDREVLLTTGSGHGTKHDLLVAKDGSGNFTTISEAVAAAPNSSNARFVIYIKAGAYFENVEVVKKKTNLMFVGDGIGKTVVKANRSVVDGWTTFRSATVAVVGKGFIAKGITFENSAGPSKHQAVALRSGSDLSAFYQCSFVGYQDTLYVHSLRQFYRECDIYGTVDFIFGNAAVVLQRCNLYARKPNENQRNIFTAQGREDPNQNTGISILDCKITAASDLIPVKLSFKTYLGRPWKEFSRTVILKSYIDDLVEPQGWLEWNATFALKTLYYGEYMNKGPGSNTSSRVTWPGYRVINSSTEARKFTVGEFIQGEEWLNSTGIPYYLNLG